MDQKRRNKSYTLRLSKDEKADLKRVSDFFGRSQADVIRCALSWYYAALVDDEKDYYCIIKGRKDEKN